MTAVVHHGEARGVDGLQRAHAVAFDARHLHQARRSDRRSCRDYAPCRFQRHFRFAALVAPMTAARPAAAIEHETPISPWQPISAAEIEAFFLYSMPIPAAVSRNLMMLSCLLGWVAAGIDIFREVIEHGRNDARRAVGRRGDDAAAARIFFIDGDGKRADHVHRLEVAGQFAFASVACCIERWRPALDVEPPGKIPSVTRPRSRQPRITSQVFISFARVAFSP